MRALLAFVIVGIATVRIEALYGCRRSDTLVQDVGINGRLPLLDRVSWAKMANWQKMCARWLLRRMEMTVVGKWLRHGHSKVLGHCSLQRKQSLCGVACKILT